MADEADADTIAVRGHSPFACHRALRVLVGGVAARLVLCVRAGQHAQDGGRRVVTRHVQGAARTPGSAHAHHVSHSQRAGPESAQQVRRTTPEHRRDVHAPAHRQRGPHDPAERARLEYLAVVEGHDLCRRDGLAVHDQGHGLVAPGVADHDGVHVVVGAQARAPAGDLEHRLVVSVPHEAIGQATRQLVGGASPGNAEGGHGASARILDQGAGAGFEHLQGGRRPGERTTPTGRQR